MPTPPRRKWFQFSLKMTFIVVTLVAVVAFGVRVVIESGKQGIVWVNVGSIDAGNDDDRQTRLQTVTDTLRANGLNTWHIGGRETFSIEVPRSDVKQARDALEESPAVRKFNFKIERRNVELPQVLK